GVCHRAAGHPRIRTPAPAYRAVVIAALVAAAIVGAGCARPRPRAAAPPAGVAAPILGVVTWNMHAGRGDLERLRYELASGVLTGGVPADYILLLQEDIEP